MKKIEEMRKGKNNWICVGLVRWKLGAMALKYVRMLSANENLQSHRMRSVLTCILRVIVNDGSPNQSGFNRLLSYGTSKSTLGLGANALFSQGFVGCSSVRNRKRERKYKKLPPNKQINKHRVLFLCILKHYTVLANLERKKLYL